MLINRATFPSVRRWAIAANLILLSGCLFGFKYFNSAVGMLQNFFPHALYRDTFTNILLPLGMSFYTFKLASYVIDVYRGNARLEKHFGIFALYVSFFPSLLAGPIDRASVLLPQFRAEQTADLRRIISGVKIIMWGLFQKVVVADQLAVYVDAVFNNVKYHTGISLIVASFFYAFQIYFDFSGYSDIAIGSAKVLGYNLTKNFNLPYNARNIRDFWRRWHISLSSWFRDYLYIPLGGDKKGRSRAYFNLVITMMICGIWHGAGLTFVVWGALHGLSLAVYKASKPSVDYISSLLNLSGRLWNLGKILSTFVLVTFLWIFFRANSIGDAFYVITHLHVGWPHLFIDAASLTQGAVGILLLVYIQFLQERKPMEQRINNWPYPVRCIVYCVVTLSVVIFGVDGGGQFIYFQF